MNFKAAGCRLHTPLSDKTITPALLCAAGMLLSGFLALCYFKQGIYGKTLGALAAKSPAWAKWPFYELVVAAIWSIFWLATAGAASDTPFVKIASYCSGISACDQINAVVALSW